MLGQAFADVTLCGSRSIIVLVFFPTYVIFQPPATVVTRKLGLSFWQLLPCSGAQKK